MSENRSLRESAQEILDLCNYFTSVLITDKDGTIVYYNNTDTSMNSVSSEEAIGKKIWEIFVNVAKSDSIIQQAINTEKSVIDRKQKLVNFKGEEFESINSSFPIKAEEKLIGIVETFSYKIPEEIQHKIEVDLPKGSPFNMYSITDIISNSESMKRLKRMVEKVSKTDSTVLLYGETGSGKELIAQSLHTGSSRCNEKFISQNCAAIPGNLLESVLFGTVKGSYTDAQDRMGLFEAANKGTLFLDEIHAMDRGVQAKLLKAVEEQEIYRVGGIEPIPIDVRIIAAINKKPEECVASGKLRNDLYYRLKVVQIDLPSLRERREDIDDLTSYFISFFNKKMDRRIKGVSEEVRKFFHHYGWPGNVREMRNIIECAYNFSKCDFLLLEDIDSYEEEIKAVQTYIEGENEQYHLKNIVEQYEQEIIKEVLLRSRNVEEASEELGVSMQTLYNKIKRYHISTSEE